MTDTSRSADEREFAMQRQSEMNPPATPWSLLYCGLNTTVAEAARLMRDAGVGGVPVLDDSDHQGLAGVLTDRDIAVKVVAEGLDPDSVLVCDVMTCNLVSCLDSDHVREVLEAMARRHAPADFFAAQH